MPKITSQKIHSILRKAEFLRKQYEETGLVRGYHPISIDGYSINERKISNPEWMGFGMRKRLPKFLSTGIFEIDPGPYDISDITTVLERDGIDYKIEDSVIVVGKDD